MEKVEETQSVPEAADFKAPVIEGSAEEDEELGQFLVAVSGRGSCLHLAKGCWRARGRRFASWELLPGVPRVGQYARFCRDCWPKELDLGAAGSQDVLGPDSLGRDISASECASSSGSSS